MGFRIFASGARNFRYEKSNCIDGSEFEVMKVAAALQTMDPSKAGAANAAIDIAAKGIADLMVKMATIESLQNLNNAVNFLAMKSSASQAIILVRATETHLLWADKIRNKTYNFSPGISPGAEFVKAIGSALKDTSLDNFGVLLQLSIALNKFSNHIDESTTPNIEISLTN